LLQLIELCVGQKLIAEGFFTTVRGPESQPNLLSQGTDDNGVDVLVRTDDIESFVQFSSDRMPIFTSHIKVLCNVTILLDSLLYLRHMGQIISYFQSLNWSAPTWDLFILLFFVIGALLYGLSLGRDRVIVILVSVYMALAVVSNTPVLSGINLSFNLNDNSVLRITIFLGLFVILFFLLSRSALLRTIGTSAAPGSWWQTIIFSVLQVGLLISITLSFLPREVTQGLSDTTKLVFMGDQGRSAWMILPILLMAIAPKAKKPEV
jgi:hypothetical protein